MRWGARLGLIGLGLFGALIAAAWVALPGIVAHQATQRLRSFGFADAQVADVTLGMGTATIGTVWLDANGANRLGPITIAWSFGGLAAGRIDDVAVADGSLTVEIADGGARIAGIPLPGGQGGGRFDMPVGRIAVTRLRLVLATPLGRTELALAETTVTPGLGVIGVAGGFTVTLADGAIEASLGGAFSAALADTVSASLDLERGRIAAGAVEAEDMAGWLVLALGRDGPELAGELGARRLTAAGIALDRPSLVVDGAPRALTVVARGAGRAGAAVRLDAVLDLTARGTGPVTMALEVPDLAGAGAPAAGNLRLLIDGRTSFDAAGEPAFAGRATFELADGALEGVAETVSASAVMGVRASPAGIVLAAQKPLVVEGLWRGPVPGPFAPLLDDTVALIVDAGLEAARGADGFTVTGRGSATFEAADGQRVTAEFGEAVVALDPAFALRRVERLAYRLVSPAIDLGVARLDAARAEGDLTGAPGAWAGRIMIDATAGIDLAEPRIHADALAIVVRGRFETAGPALSFAPTDCVALQTDEIRIGPVLVRPTNRVCALSIPEAEFLTFDSVAGLSLGVRILPFLAEATPVEPGAFPPFAVTMPKVRARLAFAADGTPGTASLNLGAGSFAVPAYQTEVTFIESEIERAAGAPYAFKLRGDLKHTAAVPAVVPVGFALTGTATAEAIAVTGSLRGGNGALALDLDARHDLDLGAGFALVRLHPLVFAPGVRAPDQIFPALGDTIEEASGTIEAEARLAWTASAPPDGQGRLALRDVDVTAAGVAAQAVNGVLTFDGLMPPSLPPGQTIAVGLLDIGVPLVNGVIEFGLGRDRVLAVDRAEWQWADGTIFAEPFRAELDRDEWRATLAASGLDLGAILAIADVDGLAGSGTLEGRLPLRLGFATVAIEDGRLATTGPGTLRYAPAPGVGVLDASQAGTDLLLDALGNFHYDSLVMDIDGVAGGETTIGLRLVGRNPDLYDGYPVALNVNLSGALDSLLRRGLAGYRIPDAVSERLATFGKEDP